MSQGIHLPASQECGTPLIDTAFTMHKHLLYYLLLYSGWCWGDAPSPERQKELLYLVRQDCGSCHGMTLKGGLGPALLPEFLHPKASDVLQATIIHGRPGTPMPAWAPFISSSEAAWIVARLKTGFPEE